MAELPPLAGRTVVVTRARAQADALAQPLEALGASVLAVPVIEIVDPEELGPVDDAIRALRSYDWVVFTSANAVERFMARVAFVDRSAKALGGVRLAAVGIATAERMREAGVAPDLVPQDANAEGLASAFRALGVGAGTRVLMPRAEHGRDVLPDELYAMGCELDVVPVYRTVPAEPPADVLARLHEGVDAVTYTSPSTVRNFAAFLAAAGIDPDGFMRSTLAGSIGPVTTRALRERGVERIVEAPQATMAALAGVLGEAFS